MSDLEQIIRERHSTRLFLPQPVPRALVEEAVVLAQHAPSNSNIQPWHMVFASGPPRDRLVKALLEEASATQHPAPARGVSALSPRAGRPSLRGDGNRPRGQGGP